MYSGVTIYFAITGALPPESIRVMMGKEDIRRPSELGIEIDPGVENGLMKSLAVDKKKRHQDVQSMINSLYNPRAPRKTVNATTQPAAATPKKVIVPRTATSATATQKATTPAAKAPAAKKPVAAEKPVASTAKTPAATAKATPKAPAAADKNKATPAAKPDAQKPETKSTKTGSGGFFAKLFKKQ